MSSNLIADVFGGDIFSQVSLTESINKLPYQPGMLGDMGLFKVDSVTGIVCLVEELNGKLSLVPTATRGSRNTEQTRTKRTMRPFNIPHLPQYDSVRADELLGIREFGSADSLKSVAKLLNDRQSVMKNDMEATKEYMRCGAIQGLVKDADGSTIYDFFDEFDVTEETEEFDFSATPAVKVKTSCTSVLRKMQFALGATRFTGVQAICGDDFWDTFISCSEVEKAFINWDSQVLQNQQRNGFSFGGIFWKNYTAKLNTTHMIPVDVCRFIPIGAGDTLKEVYAPADFVETVNTPGLPWYSKQEPMPFGKGIDLHSQSNPLIMTTRPGSLIKGTYTS